MAVALSDEADEVGEEEDDRNAICVKGEKPLTRKDNRDSCVVRDADGNMVLRRSVHALIICTFATVSCKSN